MRILSQRGYAGRRLLLRLRRYRPPAGKERGEASAGIGPNEFRVPGIAHFYGLLLLCGAQVVAAGDAGYFRHSAPDPDLRRAACQQKLELKPQADPELPRRVTIASSA